MDKCNNWVKIVWFTSQLTQMSVKTTQHCFRFYSQSNSFHIFIFDSSIFLTSNFSVFKWIHFNKLKAVPLLTEGQKYIKKKLRMQISVQQAETYSTTVMQDGLVTVNSLGKLLNHFQTVQSDCTEHGRTLISDKFSILQTRVKSSTSVPELKKLLYFQTSKLTDTNANVGSSPPLLLSISLICQLLFHRFSYMFS